MNTSNMTGSKKVMFTTVGEVHFDLDTFLLVSKLISCSIGIPLNLSIVITIARNRQLRNQPRNIFLLGIMFSYLSFFVPAAMELINWDSSPIESACQAKVAVIGLTHTLLLLNMSLALADRYMAINHPVWYRKKMTVSLACAVVILCWAVILLLTQFVYILGMGTPLCKTSNVHTKTLTVTLVILISICTALNIIVYRQTLKITSQTFNNQLTNQMATAENENIEWVELDDFVNESRNHTTSAIERFMGDHSPSIRSMPIPVDNRDDLMSETDIKATRTLIIGVTSSIITAYVSFVFISSFFACRIAMSELQCGNLTWIPAFYGSLIFLVGNDELRNAWA